MTVTDLLLANTGDGVALRFEDRCWTWDEHHAGCAAHAAALRDRLDPARPPHVGVLADNVPEFLFLLGGAALSGNVVVGLNPTRGPDALARDIAATDCQFVLATPRYAGPGTVPLADFAAPYHGAEPDPAPVTADDLLMLIFTSGTSGDPKAVRCTHEKVAGPGRMLAGRFGLGARDTVYLAMPMFHSNAVMAGWSVALAAGATMALRERFSASGFLPDVRRFGATYANYVGAPLCYVLATPPRKDDAENPLRLVYGNEGAEADLAAFADRFGVTVVDAFGSTEGGVSIARTPDAPSGSLGRLPPEVRILHEDNGKPCATAEFDADGQLTNPAEAIGELVNVAGPGMFAGYYRNPAAEAERMRGGAYHSGDLAYADADGFAWFAGRTADWLRVGGENLAAAPIEGALRRHPGIAEVAVYGVRGRTGDTVVAAVVAAPGFDPVRLPDFLAAQRDLGPRQWPTYVRMLDALPRTATAKVLKRALVADGIADAVRVPHPVDLPAPRTP